MLMTRMSLYLFRLHILMHDYHAYGRWNKEIKDLELIIETLKKLHNSSIYKALTEENEQ